jgi:glycosyltransferase involved in cell wall biosynthesis
MLESMAAGCVVIGSRTAPVLEVIQDGFNGHLTDFFDPIEMSNKISEVLQNPQQQSEIRRQARQTIQQHYDLKTICLPAQLSLILKSAA